MSAMAAAATLPLTALFNSLRLAILISRSQTLPLRRFVNTALHIVRTTIFFMPAVASNSGRLHFERVRILFLQAHREIVNFFSASGSGYRHAQPDRTCSDSAALPSIPDSRAKLDSSSPGPQPSASTSILMAAQSPRVRTHASFPLPNIPPPLQHPLPPRHLFPPHEASSYSSIST